MQASLKAAIAALGLMAAACASPAGIQAPADTPGPYVQLSHADWTRDAVIYQVNTRQFTPRGSFAAAEEQLPRLAQMGVDIVWLMPIHPIGEDRRKGTLGSPYSVKDYFAVNPEFGTLEELKSFIDTAHELDMRVILDWVANHTAWDNPIRTEHPEWFTRTPDGAMQPPPWTDWSDTADLDYSEPGLRRYMTDALVYWVREAGIDGYRADVAGFVPLDFWEQARRELEAVKPVFMLAEWETRDLHARAFDATYAWSFKDALQAAAGGAGTAPLKSYLFNHQNTWPRDGYRLLYTDNHDQNAWDGAAPEIYGEAYEAAIVTSFLFPGIPTIYNGQEAGLSRQLAFFEKDPIVWREDPLAGLFTRLAALKADNRALWNGAAGGRLKPVANTDEAHVFSFVRESDGDSVFAAINFSGEPRRVGFTSQFQRGNWRGAFTGEAVEINAGSRVDLPAWGWQILVRSEDDATQPD
ncbi:MAG: alpha-amylase [Alphaproteobacteria bacterium]|jgi:glycosidase|nr:alpha-amylase [Alphaproteobacteria bacterium]